MVGTRPRTKSADQAVGAILRRARELRKVSLDEAATTIRIPPAQLEALEEGDLTVFSAEVYARGAYLKYADYLGVKTDKRSHAFLRSLSGARERVPLRVPTPSSWLARVLTPYGVIIAGVGVAALTVATYLVLQVQSYFSVPALELTQPVDGVIVADSVTVDGRADADAHVKVNGQTVLLNEEGRFSLELPLKPGINVLEVEAEGTSGKTNSIKRDLLLPRADLEGV